MNIGEGWNLRRDVLIRMANLVRSLNTAPRTGGSPRFRWILVLPPLVGLYHWLRWAQNWMGEKAVSDLEKARILWDRLIVVHFLQRAVPVIEYDEFIECMYWILNTIFTFIQIVDYSAISCYCSDYNKKKARVDAVLYMINDASVVSSSDRTPGSNTDAMSAFQLRALWQMSKWNSRIRLLPRHRIWSWGTLVDCRV